MKEITKFTIYHDGKIFVHLKDNVYDKPTRSDLESILHAVKQAQEKLVNKQLQGIQDSVNTLELFNKFKIYGKGNDLILEKPDGIIVKLG